MLSSEGVALPSTTGQSSSWRAFDRDIPGRVTKTVLLFVGTIMFLVDDNQAGLASGVNTAERVPMMMFASPLRAASQAR